MRNTLLIDLDGVLVNSYSETPPTSMDDFNADDFNEKISTFPMNGVVHDLLVSFEAAGYRMIFLTARQEFMREATKKWLRRYGWSGYHLIMRPEGDIREDAPYKVARYRETIKPLSGNDIAFIIDDKQSIVDAFWKEENIPGFCFLGGMTPWQK